MKRTPIIWGAALGCGAWIGWSDRGGEEAARAASEARIVRIETWTGEVAEALANANGDGEIASVVRRMRRDIATNGVEESAPLETRLALEEHAQFVLTQVEDPMLGTHVNADDVKALTEAVRVLGHSASEAHRFEAKSTLARWVTTLGLGLGLGWVGWAFFGPSGLERDGRGDAGQTRARRGGGA